MAQRKKAKKTKQGDGKHTYWPTHKDSKAYKKKKKSRGQGRSSQYHIYYVISKPTVGDLIRWSRVDGNKHYLAGYAIVVEDLDNMIRIYWTRASPIPLETLEDGTCWVFKRRCIIISRHGDPDYENLRYDRRQMVEGKEN